jgi:tripartite-type tricarboxylate transporter receptor subunit TctC
MRANVLEKTVMRLLSSLVLACALSLVAPLAWAQDYPVKPIRVIVPYPAGGPTDVLGRLVGQKAGEAMGQAVVVDNRAGAGGVIGTDAVAKAAADGYTLGLANNATHATNSSLYPSLPYDAVKDFAPIALVATVTHVLVAHPSLGFKTPADLIAYAKANPGKLNIASTGNGSASHLAAELFKSRAGIDMVHVPYRGSTPAANDLLGNQVQVMIATMPTVLQHIQAGTLTALAVAGMERWPALPNLPTIDQSGMPGFNADAWFGFVAPAKTPPAVIARLNAEIAKVMAQADVKEKLFQLGFLTTASTPDAFGAFIRDETVKWAEVVKISGAKLD